MARNTSKMSSKHSGKACCNSGSESGMEYGRCGKGRKSTKSTK